MSSTLALGDKFCFGLWTVGWRAPAPFGSDGQTREGHGKRFRNAVDQTDPVVPRVTTNLFQPHAGGTGHVLRPS